MAGQFYYLSERIGRLPQHLSKGREGGEAFGEGLLVAGIADAHAVRLLEAVAGGDKRARLAVHALAEVVGRDVEVVVHERSRTRPWAS